MSSTERNPQAFSTYLLAFVAMALIVGISFLLIVGTFYLLGGMIP